MSLHKQKLETVVQRQESMSVHPDACGCRVVDIWEHPVTIEPTGFENKSLSDFTLNPFVGCPHKCPFCYVAGVSTQKLKRHLAKYGITDPDNQWGEYMLLRQWDPKVFLRSLRDAKFYPQHLKKLGGHDAVFVSSTTDAFAAIPKVASISDERHAELCAYRDAMITQALELIRDRSNLRVRILTRSTCAEDFFPLFQTFGDRLMLGSSIPSFREDLVTSYEPNASAPAARLRMLNQAAAHGIATYVAVAPIYPEMNHDDIVDVMTEIKKVNPMTVFVEPINVCGRNVQRIRQVLPAESVDVFEHKESTVTYNMDVFAKVEHIAHDLGIYDRIHLWPDQDVLMSKAARKVIPDWSAHEAWLHKWWNRVSEWPGSTSKMRALSNKVSA